MKKLFILFAFLSAILAPTAAAFDTPLLTWERGRDQQVVLGGGDETANWQVQLVGNGITPIQFNKSSKNNAGYVVYSANIPSDIPTGAYTVVTVGPGSPSTPVAVVAMVQASTKTATSSLFDLTQIVALFSFLTSLLGTLRLDKYSRLTFSSTQLQEFEGDFLGSSLVGKLQKAPISVRLKFLSDLRPSMLKYLLLQEGELLFSKARMAYAALPVAGIFLGTIAALEIMRSDGIAQTGLAIFIVITVLAIIDPVSGLAAVVAFLTSELVGGNIFSVRDLVLAGAVSFTWVSPALFAALVRQVAPLDIPGISPKAPAARIVGSLMAALVGTASFYFGVLLTNSVLYIESNFQELSFFDVGIIFVALLIRSYIASQFDTDATQKTPEPTEFYLARVNSPATALIVNSLIFSFVYIWTQSAQKSLVVSALFAIPYYLVFIGMGSNRFEFLARFPRNFIIEALLIAIICWGIFRQISSQPLLSDDAGFWFLFLASIPAIIHAQLTAIWPSAARKETITP